QELAESRRKADAARLATLEHSRNQVIAYGWHSNSTKLTVFAVQGTFKWPHFVVDTSILLELDLMLPSDDPSTTHIKLYQSAYRTWVKIKPGYVITLTEGACVYLKGKQVEDCTNFDALQNAASKAHNTPNICKNPHRERSHVQHACKRSRADTIEVLSDDDENSRSSAGPRDSCSESSAGPEDAHSSASPEDAHSSAGLEDTCSSAGSEDACSSESAGCIIVKREPSDCCCSLCCVRATLQSSFHCS
ncbi:hypothetical protein DFH94DRAFT_623755, partial [Russula ochroleuca]